MQYGICPLSIVPVRCGPNDNNEMISQLLYGDHFKVKEHRKKWSRIEICHDKYEGWVPNNQFMLLTKEEFLLIDTSKEKRLTTDFISHITSKQGVFSSILIGSRVDVAEFLGDVVEGYAPIVEASKPKLVDTALSYLNAPYLWGGKTPFGIDASGFTQMVYKINGHPLFRDTEKQATQGDPLSFIEESEPGDLAFFDNTEGIINHVGIILEDNHIIHAHGKVRIDRIDHTGIFNVKQKRYSHKLRVIKKIV